MLSRNKKLKIFSVNKTRGFLNNNKGKVFAIGLLVLFIIVNIYAFYVVITKFVQVAPEAETLALGELQSSLLMTYQQGENNLYTIKKTASQTMINSMKKFALAGLNPYKDYSDEQRTEQGLISENNCQEILGFTFWNERKVTTNTQTKKDDKTNNKVTYKDCLPKNIQEEFKKKYSEEYSQLISKQGLKAYNYDYNLINPQSNTLKLVAQTKQEMILPILSRSISNSINLNDYEQGSSDVDTVIANKGFFDSPNKLVKNNRQIEYVVLHYTAGSNVQSDLQTLTDPEKKVSAHYLISRQGDVYQLVKEKDVAWHAGCSPEMNSGDAYCNPLYENMNSKSIGIEISNLGHACKNNCVEAADTCYSDVIQSKCTHTLRNWEPYPDVQMEKTIDLVADILIRYNLGVDKIIGHEEVNPIRKQDPGPMLDIIVFRKKVAKKIEEKKSVKQEENPISNEKLNKQELNQDCSKDYDVDLNDQLATKVKLTKENLEKLDPELIKFVVQISKEESISPATVLSLITQESNGKNENSNGAGAYGVMQLTSVAVKELQDKINCDASKEANDVKCQIRYGVKYLATRSDGEKDYGGLTSYCSSNMNCFKTMQDCSNKYSNCQAIIVDKKTYSGEDAQLRYYNGWGYYNYPDYDYVENVKRFVPYWNALLCLKSSLQPQKIQEAKIIGDYHLNPSFTIEEKNPLLFFEKIVSLGKQIKNNCEFNDDSSNCLNAEIASFLSKTENQDIKIYRDDACYEPLKNKYFTLLKKENEEEATAIIRDAIRTLTDIKNCDDNLQEGCTCEVNIPARFTLLLTKDSEEVSLKYDIDWSTEEEFFKAKIPGLKITQDDEESDKVLFYKETVNKMKIFSTLVDNRGNKLAAPKECSVVASNNLLCASTNIGGEEINLLFGLQLGIVN